MAESENANQLSESEGTMEENDEPGSTNYLSDEEIRSLWQNPTFPVRTRLGIRGCYVAHCYIFQNIRWCFLVKHSVCVNKSII